MVRAIILTLMGVGSFTFFYLGIHNEQEPTAKKIFEAKEMVWFGLDFTQTHFVGAFNHGPGVASVSAAELKTKWIPAWNTLVAAEPENFNLWQTFRKRDVYYDMSSVNALNEKIDPATLINYNETKISEGTIREMVKRYDPKDKKEGVGLVFIIENFNKNTETAGLYVTFFDISSKKVLMSEFMVGKPVGFGLRNYWAGAIKDVLSWINFYEYNKWKSKYYYSIKSDTEEAVSMLQ